MTLPVLHLSGTPYEQGLQHGRQLQKRIAHNLDVYFDRFLREGGVSREEVLARARRYAVAIAAQNGAYHEGMRGIAAGSGAAFEEIVALNVRYEILYYQYAVNALQNQISPTDGCTAFALNPVVTDNGHLVIGQNWDWIPDVQGAIVYATPGDVPGSGGRTPPQTLAFTEAGILGGKIGLNTAGLGLVINGITSMSDDWARLDKPFHLRCYEILQQHTLADAVAVVTEGGRACSANYLVAQRPDRAVNLEAAPAVVNQIGWKEDVIVHANHFVDPEGIGVEEPRDDDYRRWSCRRQERLETLLRQKQPVSVGDLQQYLRDHETPPRTICRHEDPAAPIDEQYRTVTSIIIDLDESALHITDGPPCANAYQTLHLEE